MPVDNSVDNLWITIKIMNEIHLLSVFNPPNISTLCLNNMHNLHNIGILSYLINGLGAIQWVMTQLSYTKDTRMPVLLVHVDR
jgi:hypothetical protein